jgi:diguanylate cyclase (GGDEF)-like protein
LSALCALVWTLSATAVHATSTVPAAGYVPTTYRTEDGLPQNSIKTILQTHDGYLWLATQEGLARYDGRHFTAFTTYDHPKLISNNIHNVLEDANGTLWIYANSGLCHYTHGVFTDCSPPDRVHALQLGHDGRVYVLTDTRIYRCLSDRLTEIVCFSDITHQKGWPEPKFVIGGDGTVWWIQSGRVFRSSNGATAEIAVPAGADISALALHDDTPWIGGNGLFAVRDLKAKPEIDARHFSDHIDSLSDDGERIWVQTFRNLLSVRSDAAPSISARYPHGWGLYHPVRDCEGHIWWVAVGQATDRLLRFDGVRFVEYQAGSTLPIDSGYAPVLLDREGIVWIGGIDGLECFRPIPDHTYASGSSMPAGGVQTVLVDRSGAVWVGTKLHGFGQLKNGRFVPYPDPRLQVGHTDDICDDDHSGLWVMSNGHLFHCGSRGAEDVTRKVWPHDPGWVTGLYVDKRDRLWIASDDLLCFDGIRTTVAPLSREQTGGRTFAVCSDGAEGLWVSGSEGIGHIFHGHVQWYGANWGLPSVPIIDIHRESNGALWMATWGAGLLRYANGKFMSITTRDGLFADSVHRIIEDDAGFFWIGSSKGVFMVRRHDLDRYVDGLDTDFNCTSIGPASGADGGMCAAGVYPAGWPDEHGGAWFPAVRGLMHLMPETHKSAYRGPVAIEDATLDGRSFSTDLPAHVPPGSGAAEFRFACLSFLSPNRIQYRYRLFGFENGWIESTGDPVAHYTNLPPGRYRFQVEARNEIDQTLIGSAEFRFTLLPHFYQTRWFQLLLILLIAALPASFFALRARTLRRHALELESKVVERTAELADRNEELMAMQTELEAQTESLAEANAMLEGLATTDGLTGLKNHRTFQEFLSRAWAEARRHESDLSVILMDVDQFKMYNDTFGHQEGDVVLKSVSRILTEATRESDLLARYGGEEFVVVLPRTSATDALAAAERYRAAIEASDWPLRAITGSFGVATIQVDMNAPAELIAAADAALYRSKHAGRNRATHAQSTPPDISAAA